MNHSISISTFALASLAAVLLSTLMTGITSASSRGFSNGGNNIITDQNCTADNSCVLSSSNVITGQPGSTIPPATTPPDPINPCGEASRSELHLEATLAIVPNPPPPHLGLTLHGSLVCLPGPRPVAGAIITLTSPPTNPPTFGTNLVLSTKNDGTYSTPTFFPVSPGMYTVEARFFGITGGESTFPLPAAIDRITFDMPPRP